MLPARNEYAPTNGGGGGNRAAFIYHGSGKGGDPAAARAFHSPAHSHPIAMRLAFPPAAAVLTLTERSSTRNSSG